MKRSAKLRFFRDLKVEDTKVRYIDWKQHPHFSRGDSSGFFLGTTFFQRFAKKSIYIYDLEFLISLALLMTQNSSDKLLEGRGKCTWLLSRMDIESLGTGSQQASLKGSCLLKKNIATV